MEGENSALFSRRDLKRLILPLVVEQFLAVTIGMMDTIMVSTCGEAAVSGVSLVDSVNIPVSYTHLPAGFAVFLRCCV